MFEFAFAVGIALIGVMITTYHYLSGIDTLIEEAHETLATEFASSYTKSFEELERKYPGNKEPPHEEIENTLANWLKEQISPSK